MEWAAWSAGTGPPVGTSTQPSSSTTEETAEGVSSPKEQAAARDRRPSATSPVKAWKCRRSSRRVAATFRALGNGRRLVADLHAIREEWGHSIRARRDSAVWRAVEVVLRYPVVNHGTMGRELGSPNPDRHLRQLVDAGVLVEFTGKRRNRLWRAPQVLAALDVFAEQAGRRPMPSDLSRAQITALDRLRSRPRIDVAPVNSHHPS